MNAVKIPYLGVTNDKRMRATAEVFPWRFCKLTTSSPCVLFQDTHDVNEERRQTFCHQAKEHSFIFRGKECNVIYDVEESVFVKAMC